MPDLATNVLYDGDNQSRVSVDKRPSDKTDAQPHITPDDSTQ